MVAVREVDRSEYNTACSQEGEHLNDSNKYDSNNSKIPKEDLEKRRMILQGKEGVSLEIPHDKPKCRFRKSHRKSKKKLRKVFGGRT